MLWSRKKNIFTANAHHDLMVSYAQIPTPLKLSDEVYRIYFSSRSNAGQAYPYYLDYDFAADRIVRIETQPLWRHGAPGSFDDSGAMPACAIRVDGKVFLYYIGWTTGKSVPYHLSIGLAVSEDGGRTFEKYPGPVMDRAFDEPFFNTAPCILPEAGRLQMWYISSTGWQEVNGSKEPVYRIRRAESADGISWRRDEGPAVDYKFDGEALGRPWVMKTASGYSMWYSTRGSVNYRQPGGQTYSIGYADSEDGLRWIRKDDQFDIPRPPSEWDSDMMEYCAILELPGRDVILYNGNTFGLTGFGYAERVRQ